MRRLQKDAVHPVEEFSRARDRVGSGRHGAFDIDAARPVRRRLRRLTPRVDGLEAREDLHGGEANCKRLDRRY